MAFRLLSLALSFLPSSDQFFQSDMVPPAEIMIGLLTPLWVGSFGLMSVRFAKYCFLGHTFSCHTPTRAGWIVLWLAFCFLIDPVMGVEPNVQKDYDTLPGVSMWNGIPFNTFRTAWWPTLVAALGSIFQEGWTLYSTAQNLDLGSPGNPGTPAQQVQSQNRNIRLYFCIMKYISTNSMLYRRAQAAFQNDGRGLYGYLFNLSLIHI